MATLKPSILLSSESPRYRVGATHLKLAYYFQRLLSRWNFNTFSEFKCQVSVARVSKLMKIRVRFPTFAVSINSLNHSNTYWDKLLIKGKSRSPLFAKNNRKIRGLYWVKSAFFTTCPTEYVGKIVNLAWALSLIVEMKSKYCNSLQLYLPFVNKINCFWL